MDKHTAAPWKKFLDEDDGTIEISTDDRMDRSAIPIALVDVGYSGPIEIEQQANADFIVLACNSHAGMVEALQTCKQVLAESSASFWAVAAQAELKARAALAQLEVKP